MDDLSRCAVILGKHGHSIPTAAGLDLDWAIADAFVSESSQIQTECLAAGLTERQLGFALCIADDEPTRVRLLKVGADPNAGNRTALGTPLHAAVAGVPEHSEETIHFLCRFGAYVDSVDNEGNTPLHWSVGLSRWRSIRALAKLGANCNLKNDEGLTPLHVLAGTERRWVDDDFKCLELLLSSGAEVLLKSSKGLTALDLARERDESMPKSVDDRLSTIRKISKYLARRV